MLRVQHPQTSEFAPKMELNTARSKDINNNIIKYAEYARPTRIRAKRSTNEFYMLNVYYKQALACAGVCVCCACVGVFVCKQRLLCFYDFKWKSLNFDPRFCFLSLSVRCSQSSQRITKE